VPAAPLPTTARACGVRCGAGEPLTGVLGPVPVLRPSVWSGEPLCAAEVMTAVDVAADEALAGVVAPEGAAEVAAAALRANRSTVTSGVTPTGTRGKAGDPAAELLEEAVVGAAGGANSFAPYCCGDGPTPPPPPTPSGSRGLTFRSVATDNIAPPRASANTSTTDRHNERGGTRAQMEESDDKPDRKKGNRSRKIESAEDREKPKRTRHKGHDRAQELHDTQRQADYAVTIDTQNRQIRSRYSDQSASAATGGGGGGLWRAGGMAADRDDDDDDEV
jgi:hypothetical protein